jgi:hypothetical protein
MMTREDPRNAYDRKQGRERRKELQEKKREDGRKWRQEVRVYLYLLCVLCIHFSNNVGIL